MPKVSETIQHDLTAFDAVIEEIVKKFAAVETARQRLVEIGHDPAKLDAKLSALNDTLSKNPVFFEQVSAVSAGLSRKPQIKNDPFPVHLLPAVMRDYIAEGARSRATDRSVVGLPLLVTLASCVGMSRRISPKNGWSEPSILWGAVVGQSGSVKSPGLDLSRELLDACENESYRSHKLAMDDYAGQLALYERDLSAWKRSKSMEPPPEQPPKPIATRLKVDDVTLESIVPILSENPKGLLVLSDELAGWFGGMGLYSSKGSGGRDESRWLVLHGGRDFSLDRKTGRERVYIPNAAASVAGTIQPGTLANVVKGGQVESGLLARLLLVMPPSQAKQWTDDVLSSRVRDAMQSVVDRLRSLSMDYSFETPRPIDVPITLDARNRFASFVNSHGQETIGHTESLAAAWSKLEGYSLRFALIIHLVQWAESGLPESEIGPVEIESIEAGIELARWFACEAERVYASIGVVSSVQGTAQLARRDAMRLLEWIDSRGGKATEREIGRGLRRYEDESLIATDCRWLIDRGLAKWQSDSRTRYIVSEKYSADSADTSSKNTEKIDEVSAETPESGHLVADSFARVSI